MSQSGINRLKGVDIAFLTADPDRHQDLIDHLDVRESRLQIAPSLDLCEEVDLILIEANFPYFKILKFLKRLQNSHSTACILLIGPDLDVGRVSALLRGGVFDYLKTPVSLKRLGKAIQKGLKNRENLLKVLKLSDNLEIANRALSEERDHLKKWNDDLNRLFELNQTLSESLHIDEIVKSLTANIKKVLAYDISALYLRKWNKVRVEADSHQSHDLIQKIKEETHLNGLQFIKEEYPFTQTAVRQGGSEIMVPLAVGTNKIGLLRLIRMPYLSNPSRLNDLPQNGEGGKGSFNNYQAKILSMISIPLAIAIRNAEMYQQVEDLSVKDALTGVLNRRAFTGILEREFKRAYRYDIPLALMVIDLDHFKKVNDTYGHLVGDQVLREMALTFKSSLRDIDVLIRYGGEEFVVILPGTNLQEGLIVASRIKDRVENKLFNEEKCPMRMTVSIGVAHYPVSNIETPQALFERADQALYTAKKNGRNRIMVLKPMKEAEWSILALDGRGV